VSVAFVPSASAQPEWQLPTLLAAPTDAERLSNMALVADASDRLHLFVPAVEGDVGLVKYWMWEDGGWTDPVDVVAVREVRPSYMDVTAAWDGLRTLYLLHGDGTTRMADLASADTALAWTNGPAFADSLVHGVHAVGQAGQVMIVYTTTSRGGGTVWFRTLTADGLGEPVAITELDAGRTSDWPRLAIDSRGVLHAVWTELTAPTGWPPLGVYYSRSEDGGATWLEPVELATGLYDQVNVGVAPDDVVHVVWLGAVGQGGRYHRYSADGGSTWSPTVTIVTEGFTTGLPRIDFDSSGTTHLVYAHEDATYHTSWGESGWQEPVPLRPSEQQIAERGGGNLTGEWSQFAVTGGNQLHVLFKSTGAIWHTSRTLAAPEVPPAPTPDPLEAVDLAGGSGDGPGSLIAAPAATAPPTATDAPAGSELLTDRTLGPPQGPVNSAAVIGTVAAAVVVVAAVRRRRP
jgi:hypothetical protein